MNDIDRQLVLACEAGDRAEVDRLLAAGADVAARDDLGWTPLHFVAVQGHVPIAELLVWHGAEVNAQSNCGNTPLHWAARWNNEAMVDALLSRGADPTITDQHGCDPAAMAEAWDHHELAGALRSAATRRRARRSRPSATIELDEELVP